MAFDQSGYNRIGFARKKLALSSKEFRSVLDFWKSDHIEEGITYPVAGAFVEFLFQKSTIDQFKSIIKGQTIRNAKKTYGKDKFEELIDEFDKLVGLK